MFVVRAVQTLAEWPALKPVWETLIRADSKASLCNSWEWNDAWVQQFWQSHFSLQVFIVETRHDGHEPVALLPLYLNQHSGEVLMLGTGEPEHSEVASEYLDMLLNDQHAYSDQVQSSLRSSLQQLRCHSIRFINCLQSSRVLQLMAASPRVNREPTGRQFGIALSQTLPELMQQFSYKQRKNGQLILNRFDKNAALTFSVMVDGKETGLWPQLQELHQADWTSRQQQGAFASADFIQFHERLQRSEGAVQALFAVLRHDQEAIAVNYYYQFRQRLYFYQSGTVKDRFQQYSPGKMLHMLAFRELCGSPLYYDFMKGALQGSYKASMCPEGELLYDMIVYQRNVGGMTRWARAELKRWLKRKPDKAGEGSAAAESQTD